MLFFRVLAREIEIINAAYITEDILKIDYKLPLSLKDWKTIMHTFGKYCVVMRYDELFIKVKKKFLNHDDYYLGNCIYEKYKEEDIEKFKKGDISRFLFKNPMLEYQHEYRVLYFSEMPKNHFLELGEFEQLAIVRTEDLFNSTFNLEIKVKRTK